MTLSSLADNSAVAMTVLSSAALLAALAAPNIVLQRSMMLSAALAGVFAASVSAEQRRSGTDSALGGTTARREQAMTNVALDGFRQRISAVLTYTLVFHVCLMLFVHQQRIVDAGTGLPNLAGGAGNNPLFQIPEVVPKLRVYAFAPHALLLCVLLVEFLQFSLSSDTVLAALRGTVLSALTAVSVTQIAYVVYLASVLSMAALERPENREFLGGKDAQLTGLRMAGAVGTGAIFTMGGALLAACVFAGVQVRTQMNASSTNAQSLH